VKEAGDRYSRGLQLYTEGDYALAVIEFERAYSLVPEYRVLYNIGQVRLQLANYAKARRALEQYLSQGGERIPEERRNAVLADLQMLVARTATLRIDSSIVGAEIQVDEVSVGHVPLAEPLLLDAGEHRIVVQRAGYQAQATQVTLAGLDEKSVRVDLERIPENKSIIVEKSNSESNRSTWLWATWSATGVFAI
jgi:tetratricopeptide (TPR) repeat protein